MRWRELAFGMLGGAVVGTAITAWLAADSAAAARAARVADEAARADALALETEPHTRARLDAPPPSRATRDDDDGRAPARDSLESLLVRLRPHAEAGIRRGWTTKRTDEIPDDVLAEARSGYDALVREAPVRSGAELAERATRREKAHEDARTGGAFTLLDELAQGGTGPLPELVRDAQKFAALFRRMSSGPARNGVAEIDHVDRLAQDGATISYPAGVFRCAALMRERRPFPRDVTIAGAGMDATLLLVSQLSTREELRNFTLQDCTVYTSGRSLFDLRRRPGTVQLERVRVIGFDVAAGSSSAFEAPGLALFARDSLVLGGYGPAPASGRLFDVRNDALLARFERCTLDELSVGTDRMRPGSTLVFVDCVLSNLLDARSPLESGLPGLALVGCRVTRFESDREALPVHDLNELFPSWQQRINQ
ncbi:MAG: hypothetical protein ACKVWV_08650 [Planctomycetota bacterium]